MAGYKTQFQGRLQAVGLHRLNASAATAAPPCMTGGATRAVSHVQERAPSRPSHLAIHHIMRYFTFRAAGQPLHAILALRRHRLAYIWYSLLSPKHFVLLPRIPHCVLPHQLLYIPHCLITPALYIRYCLVTPALYIWYCRISSSSS